MAMSAKASDDIAWLPATAQLAVLAAKKVSSAELVELYLSRIDTYNASLNAIVTVDPDAARRVAKRSDAARARGDELGPLHGLPITVKDSYETAGMRTTCGRRDLADYVPTQDAEAVARLRRAGAIIMGKTNMPTGNQDVQASNPVFGRTNNPWDEAGHELIERHMLEQLREVAEYTRVVLINGPRQAGKTTLLQQLHAELGGWLRSLDVDVERASARADPEGYIMSAPRPTFLDEVQCAGDPLILAIKTATDRDRRPRQFFLSGSTRFLTVPTLSESLAGRVAILDLWPLSVAERSGVRPEIIAQLFTEPQVVLGTEPAPVTRHEYLQLACAGGFPEVVQRPAGRARSRWFSDYLRTVTQRDVRELKRIEQTDRLPRFMRYLAAITAQELNVAEAARVIGVDAGTIRSDLALFETVYLVHRLPAWSRNLTAKIKKRSKIHVVDSGFAAWLRGQSADSLARPTAEGAGPIMETFVINELMKLRAATELEVDLYHFRDRDGREIDCILQTPDSRVVGVEVKASATVNVHDFRHLSFARDRLGDEFITGVLFYTGARALPFGDRLMALPINLLWNGQSVSSL